MAFKGWNRAHCYARLPLAGSVSGIRGPGVETGEPIEDGSLSQLGNRSPLYFHNSDTVISQSPDRHPDDQRNRSSVGQLS